MKTRLGMLLLSCCFTVPALAEDVVMSVQPTAQLRLVPLADQTLTESTTVSVQPQDAGSPAGAMSEPLPEYCLLSVQVTLGSGQAELAPGKMVCITEDRRVLEAQPKANITGLGECQGTACGRYRLSTERSGTLSLTEPLIFTLQPRNMSN